MAQIEIVRGDLTHQSVDAIVNAANESLLGGGGVDGAIHRAAGPELLRQCASIGGCSTGQAVITQGYELAAKFVIHTVGPVWHGGHHDEPELLASCYQTTLALARKHQCATVAYPAISCGVFGYPLDRAAQTALATVKDACKGHELPELVRWVLFDELAYESWKAALAVLNRA